MSPSHFPTTPRNRRSYRGLSLPKRVTERGRDHCEIAFDRTNLFGSRSSASLIETSDEARVEMSGHELLVLGNFAEEWQVGRDSRNFILVKRAPQTLDRLVARTPPNRNLRDHRIVVNRNFRMRRDPTVDPDPRTRRFAQMCDRAGTRKVIVRRIFRINATLDRVAVPANLFLCERQRLTGRHPKLFAHEIATRNQFGHWMLDL